MNLPIIKQKKSGWNYRVRFTDSEGKKHQKYFSGFGSRQEAAEHFMKTSHEYKG